MWTLRKVRLGLPLSPSGRFAGWGRGWRAKRAGRGLSPQPQMWLLPSPPRFARTLSPKGRGEERGRTAIGDRPARKRGREVTTGVPPNKQVEERPMTRLGFTIATLLALAIGPAAAQDKLTLQLKWVTQAQFAGYYVAKDKGFYKEVGLDVTVKPGGPDVNPSQVIAGGGADVVVDWMPSALATREKGVPLVNIAQVFQRSGMMLTCRKDSGIAQPTDFKGRTLGVWFAGNEYPFLAWMDKLGYKTTGGPDGVRVLKQGFNVDPLLQKQADCISTMTYNEYWQVVDAGVKPEDLVVFKYEDQGVATLEDGLYVREDKLKD